jgi:hypothetical protein
MAAPEGILYVTSLIQNHFGNYSASEGIGGCGVAASPPHHTPNPSAPGLPEQLPILCK